MVGASRVLCALERLFPWVSQPPKLTVENRTPASTRRRAASAPCPERRVAVQFANVSRLLGGQVERLTGLVALEDFERLLVERVETVHEVVRLVQVQRSRCRTCEAGRRAFPVLRA